MGPAPASFGGNLKHGELVSKHVISRTLASYKPTKGECTVAYIRTDAGEHALVQAIKGVKMGKVSSNI